MSSPLLVTTIGLPQREHNVLKSILYLSSTRTHAYTLARENQTPDIVLVDSDVPAAVSEWQALCHKDEPSGSPATVMVSQDGSAPQGTLYTLKRPIVASRVFSVLDEIAATLRPVSSAILYHRALVVDDSPTTRKQLEIELERLGIAAECVETAEQALDLLGPSKGYDVIFLDVMLPGIDGYKLCKTIKRNKIHKHTPVIMLTGKGSPFDRVRGKFAGCNTYLTKPVSREKFQHAVHKYLR
ncbi:MAG: response regulator [Candidatus Tectimicrobiota bacterium]